MKNLMTTLRNILMGLILFLITVYLVSCTTPPSATAFDPNLSAVQAELTAQAAANQAQLYSAMATGTAQAPIIAITQTAAAQQLNATTTAQALAYQQQAWTITAQSVQSTETAAMTATAMAWTPTPNATMTAVFAQSYADATRVANEITLNNLAVERAEINNNARAIFFTMLGVAVMLVGIAYAYTRIKLLSIKPMSVDERGRIIPITNVLEGTFADIERSPNAVISMKEKLLARLPAITPERQAEVTALSQRVDLATRTKLPMRLLNELGSSGARALPTPDEEDPVLIDYPLPEWNDWMQNWKPGHLALGINEQGLLQVDPEANSHFLFAGTTGSGKTRSGVRVLITCALASGWQVIIAGKDLDYKVFENHPNAYMVPFSLLTDPTRAIDLLRSVYGEIERRTRMMSRSNYGLWRETGQSRTMVVVDEFSNLADALEDIDRSRRDELWRWARMDTAEARKYGLHMVYALQDPTARSIDIRIRRNTTPVVFRVKDAAASRTVLNVNGAEMLSVRHFLANVVRLERGAAFAPSDPDILQFLHDHPARTEEPPSWAEGVLVPDPALDDGKKDLIEGPTDQKPTDSVGDWLHTLDDKQGKVIDLHIEGEKSDTKIAIEAYGYANNASLLKVRSLIAEYDRRNPRATTTTTTTTPQNMPEFGPAPA